MKKIPARKSSALRLKSEDLHNVEETSDWIIVRLHAKVKSNEVKYSDLLCRVHKFIGDFKQFFDKIFVEIDEKEQEKLNSDISYFLNTNDSLYTAELFASFKQDVQEKLNSKDFTKEGFKSYFANAFDGLTQGITVGQNLHEKKKSQQTLKSFDNSFSLKRDLTPIRHSKRSASPYDIVQHNYQKENAELKQFLAGVSQQRDVLKAWKENAIKNPNFELTAQKIIKELREDSELLTIKNTCLQSKLAYLVNSVSNFLSVSSRFQKPVREKEGYLSINNYENEKHKLEVKLREVLENNENFGRYTPVLTQSVLRTVDTEKGFMHKEEVFRHEPRKLVMENMSSQLERSSKNIISDLNKQFLEKSEGLKSIISKLEGENRTIKNKYFVLKKEIKVLKNAISELKKQKNQEIYSKPQRNVKDAFENMVREVTSTVEDKFVEIMKKINRKDNDIKNLKAKFTMSLEQNLKSLIAINETAEKDDGKAIKEYKDQIENLEYVIIQNKNYSDNVIFELEEAISEYENSKKISQRVKKSLEEELTKLTKEVTKIQSLEATIKLLTNTVSDLEEVNKQQAGTITYLHQFEAIADQYKYERNIFEQENLRISEDLIMKSKIILEMQQKLQSQATEANKHIEEVEFQKQALSEELKKFSSQFSEEKILKSDQEKENLKNQCIHLSRQLENIEKNNTNKLETSGTEQSKEQGKPQSQCEELKAQLQTIENELAKTKKSGLEKLTKVVEELKSAQKELIFAKNDKEILNLELSKTRENYRNFESFLKGKMRMLESTPYEKVSMRRINLDEYKFDQ